MSSGNNNRPASIEVLESRIGRLQTELAATDDVVAQVKAKQVAALVAADLEIDRERCHAEQLLQNMRDQLAVAAKKREQGQALIVSGKKLLAEAVQEESAASDMDVGEAAIEGALQTKRDVVRFWSEELAKVQTGRARRKRTQLEADLEKLSRRVAAKKEPPRPRGTVETDVILPCALCHETPRLKEVPFIPMTAGVLPAVHYHLGCRCGRGSAAEDARDAVLGWNAQANDLQRARASRDTLEKHKAADVAARQGVPGSGR